MIFSEFFFHFGQSTDILGVLFSFWTRKMKILDRYGYFGRKKSLSPSYFFILVKAQAFLVCVFHFGAGKSKSRISMHFVDQDCLCLVCTMQIRPRLSVLGVPNAD
jgi:hypothetical protein